MGTMRIAFFGGSFDPPHVGHLRIAQAAAERLRLDRILLAPVALQPLKRELKVPPPASYTDRLAMLQLFIADQASSTNTTPTHARFDYAISELDAPRPDHQPNYTYDTLLQLRAQLDSLPQQNELFVLLGADSFLSMHRWHRAADLLVLTDWIIAARPGFLLTRLTEALPECVRPTAPAEQGDRCIKQQLTDQAGRTTTLYLLPDLHMDVSATEIRAALAQNAGSLQVADCTPRNLTSLPGLAGVTRLPVLSPSVAAYIRARGLYR